MKTPKIDPLYAVCAAGLLIVAATSAPGKIQEFTQQRQMAASLQAQNQAEQIKARLANADSQRRSQLAVDRFKAGCQMVFAGADPSKFTAIGEGKPVFDPTTNQPVSDGVVLCDQTGQTAVIRDGVAQDLAFATDRQVVADAMQRYQGAEYAAPQQ